MQHLTQAELLHALRDCYDPELPCNIVDLGLVRSVTLTLDPDAPGAGIPGVEPKYSVAILVAPSTANEATHAQLSAQVANRLAGLPSVSQTRIEIQKEPRWTPMWITPAGRRTLGLDGNPALIQIR